MNGSDVFDDDDISSLLNDYDVPQYAEDTYGVLVDVPIQVEIRQGTVTCPLVDLIGLQPGYRLDLNQKTGSPVEILVNGRIIAKGLVSMVSVEFPDGTSSWQQVEVTVTEMVK